MLKKILTYLDNFFYRKLLKSLLKTSKLGYGVIVTGAESGVNYEHMYDNIAKGKFIVGKFFDRILLNLPAVEATRGRKDDIRRVLWNEIYNNKILGRKTRVLDLASGGARYLRELRDEHNAGLVESICIDRDSRSIVLGKGLAKKEGLSNIKFFKGDLFKLGRLRYFSTKNNWTPNVIIASGIFIYLNDETVEGILCEMYEALPQKGRVIFSSYEKLNTRKLMRKTMQTTDGQEWTLYYRKPQHWRNILTRIGFTDIFVFRDKWEMNNICTARK